MKNVIDKVLGLSIGTKLSLTFVVLIAITSIPLSFIVIRSSEQIYYNNIVKSIKDAITSEELQLRYYIINKDYWSLFKFVKGLSNKDSVSEVAVVDGYNKVLAHSNPQKYPIGSLYHERGDINYPIKGLDSNLGFVILGISHENVWANFKPIKLFLMFSTLPFTGVSLLLGLLIAYRIKSRLSRIQSSIEKIRRGELDNVSRAVFKEKDELQDFSDFLFDTISELRNYYENIDYAQKFYMNLLNTINEVVLVTDKEGRILYANGKIKQFGYEINELIGLSLNTVIEETKRNEDSSGHKYREVVFKGKGRSIPALMGVVDYDSWLIVTLIDISHRKSIEERLKKMELFSTLGEMSANFAHELKNTMLPLNLLSSVNDLTKEDIEVIKNSISRMGRLVNTFLNFARPVTIENTKFRISTIVDEVLFLTTSKTKNKKLKIVKDIEDREIISSRDLIEIILINLLSNSIDAVRDEGEIGIKMYVAGDTLNIEVWDTGEGIADSDMDRIFEPFYTTKNTGSGLGLSIVLKNVYMLKGNVYVSSNRGKGTRFVVSIPLGKGA